MEGALDLTKQALLHHAPQGDDELSQGGLGPPIYARETGNLTSHGTAYDPLKKID